jgi:hypothetical protein
MDAITPGDFMVLPFIYEDLCISNFPDNGGGIILSDEYGIITELNHRKDLLQGAQLTYELTVDKGDSESIISTINSALSNESQLLKTLLLQKYPLSDEVMKAAISKTEPMDPWHLTQVMVANAPLSKGLTAFLEDSDVLSDFFMSFVHDANAGGGLGSLAKLLELEISYRSTNYYKQLQKLQYHHQFSSEDSTITTLNQQLSQLTDWNSLVTMTNRDLFNQNTVGFNSGLSEIDTFSEDLADWFEFVSTLPQNLDSISSAEIGEMHTKYLMGEEEKGFVLAYLMALDEVLDFPDLKEPVAERSYFEENTTYAKDDFFGVYPNPVQTITYLTYPVELDGYAEVRVVDLSGRIIIPLITLSSGGIKEFSFEKLQSGMYFIEVILDEQVFETVKFIK